ncbi:MAG: putative membrane protein YdjX (TVP38/TMEM64 family) [Lentimonas sp.]|jgi:uncharacterized membrane protein YdjX (TVP38/TMEM64 family)
MLPLMQNVPNLAIMPNQPEPSKRLIRLLLLLLLAALIGAAAVYYIWSAHPDLEYWKTLGSNGYAYLEAHPILLVVVLATLPGIGCPMSPLLIIFGIVMGPRFGLPATCAIGIAATSFCSIWTYALASGPLRVFLKKHLLNKWAIPEFSDSSALRLGIIVRITPGIPYPVQNVALGVMGMRFKTYLLASLPAQSLYTIGFIVTGGALFEGRAGLAITAVLFLIIIILVTRILNKPSTSYVG